MLTYSSSPTRMRRLLRPDLSKRAAVSATDELLHSAGMSVGAAEVWTALYAQRARVLPVLPLACLGAAEEVSGLALYAQRAGVFLPALTLACLSKLRKSGRICARRGLAFYLPYAA